MSVSARPEKVPTVSSLLSLYAQPGNAPPRDLIPGETFVATVETIRRYLPNVMLDVPLPAQQNVICIVRIGENSTGKLIILDSTELTRRQAIGRVYRRECADGKNA